MNTFHCAKCKQPVDLDDEEVLVFTDNNLRDGDSLSECPYCLTETISTSTSVEHMRRVGQSARWGMCGYHSTDDERIISVERRYRE